MLWIYTLFYPEFASNTVFYPGLQRYFSMYILSLPYLFCPYPPHLSMYKSCFMYLCCEYIYCSIPSLLLKLSFTQGLKWRYYNTYFRVLLTHRNTSLFVLSVLLSPCSFNRLKNTKRKCVELLMCYMRALSLNVPAAYFVARRIYSCSFRLCPPVFILVP